MKQITQIFLEGESLTLMLEAIRHFSEKLLTIFRTKFHY